MERLLIRMFYLHYYINFRVCGITIINLIPRFVIPLFFDLILIISLYKLSSNLMVIPLVLLPFIVYFSFYHFRLKLVNWDYMDIFQRFLHGNFYNIGLTKEYPLTKTQYREWLLIRKVINL